MAPCRALSRNSRISWGIRGENYGSGLNKAGRIHTAALRFRLRRRASAVQYTFVSLGRVQRYFAALNIKILPVTLLICPFFLLTGSFLIILLIKIGFFAIRTVKDSL